MSLLLIILATILCFLLYKTLKVEKYEEIPDACVHMMERGGFSDVAVQACQNYAKRCGDACSPYPMTTAEMKEISAKYGILDSGKISSEQDAAVVNAFNNAKCLSGFGPGKPCVSGEEECPSPYVCVNGKCQCKPHACSIDDAC